MTGQTSLTSAQADSLRVTGPMTGTSIAAHLESWIVTGRWQPGERLPSERQLVEQFGVSRSVVREVLRSLQERGLIDAHPGRGSFVREVRTTDGLASLDVLARRGRVTARHLVTARQMLECEAAALAAEHHAPPDARELKTILQAFDAAPDPAIAAELDIRFHETVARSSGNPVIQIMFASIRPLVAGLVLRSLTDRKVRAIGAPYHEVVLTAILDRDAEAARRGMAEHMAIAMRNYGKDLDLPLSVMLAQRADHEPMVAELLRNASDAISAVEGG
jgi:DNA-binding FadR family transcriptional regulator